MILLSRLLLLALILLFLLCALAVHLRSRVRLHWRKQLGSHATLFAPYNLLMYAFSAVRARPFAERARFPQLDPLRDHWREVRDEALHLFDQGFIRAAERNNDASFNSFFKEGWKRFYVKWYGEPLGSAQALCPRTVALVNAIPTVKAAMFALLPPDSKLNPHRDPFAGSLRYHLGLVTPNANSCRIFVDGEEYFWRDGEDVIFDETLVHSAENKSGITRVILFCDIDRPLRWRWMSSLNHRVGAFMGRITSSPNTEAEPVGFLNRLYALGQRNRERGKRFKHANPRLFRGAKTVGIIVLLWIVLLAPWPLVR
ncbi:MAG TPA: aspartyl/asparaginyl beta-hydroxylase domain-containing protein [Rhodanobacteraceae bacterium]|nr:aspartyl/asparaginyl beta-hydroxylase domain-containing protein [Rhodanobacteraceae bacterium]